MKERALVAIVFFSVVAASIVCSFTPPFSDFIAEASNRVIPYSAPDIQFDFFVGALLGLLCGIVLLAVPIPQNLRAIVLLCWTVRLATALYLVLIYEYHYGLDIDGYFYFADMPAQPPANVAGGLGTWHVRMLAWAMFKIIGPSYHGGKVLFSFLAYIGIYLAYRGAVTFLKEERPLLFLVMAMSPTCLFWSSTLGKDPVILFAIGLYAHGCFGLFSEFKRRHFIEVFLGILIAALVRNYFIPIMTIPLALAYLTETKRPVVRVMAFPLIAWGLYFSLTSFTQRLQVDSFDSFFAYQANVTAGWSGGSSFILPVINNPVMLILVGPLAIFTALFRPTIFEVHNPFALGAAIDNTFLLVLFFYAWSRSKFREFSQPRVLWMSSFVLIWSAMYGIGTGNLGAISRFKIQVLPIFLILLFYMAQKRAPARQASL